MLPASSGLTHRARRLLGGGSKGIRRGALVGVAAALVAGVPALAATSSARTAAVTGSVVGVTARPGGGGWTVTSTGAVVAQGGAPTFGSLASTTLAKPVIGMASTPDGQGYWLVTSNGAVRAFGDAHFYGSLANPTSEAGQVLQAGPAVVGMAATQDGKGYWVVASTGAVYAFGDAHLYGSARSTQVVGMVTTQDGRGYWLAASSGSVFAFGDARLYGSVAASRLTKPIVAMAPTSDRRGYWLLASDGGAYSFGDASTLGPTVGSLTGDTAVGMAAVSTGYVVATAAGSLLSAPWGPGWPAVASLPGATTITTPTSTSTTTPTTSPAPTSSTPTPTTSTTTPTSTKPSGPMLGVLDADSSHLAADQAAGIRLVTLNVGWNWWEPTQGQFSASYRAQQRAIADQYRAAGMSVAVDIGLQYAPGWVAGLANGQLVDQNGASPGTADFAWSQAVRGAATAYIDDVVASLGPVVDYRVGLSENGETLYPDTNGNQWWAYTPSAQGTATGLPAGLSSTPMPGWVPGTSTYQGQAVTVAQASTWYDWYFSGSASALAWEIATYRSAGYQGQLELVMPGDGSLPAFYDQRMSYLLADGAAVGQHYDDFHTMNTAAVWWKLLDALPDLQGVAIDISSVDDGSGSPRANACTASDASVAYDSSAIWSWSDTRWLTYLAAQHNLPVLGENPGGSPASQLPNIMGLVTGCHLQSLQWAWDDNLYANDGTATISQLTSAFFGS